MKQATSIPKVSQGAGAPATPAAPGAPAAPAAPGAGNTFSVGLGGVNALSPGDLAALKKRGDELSRQINSASSRRDNVRAELRQASGADRTGLEGRLQVLDDRIVSLEKDIAENGRQLASLPAARSASRGDQYGGYTSPGSPGMDRAFIPVAIVFTIFVLMPIAVSVARLFWRRGSNPRPPQALQENNQRLERMEQAMDAIAIEVERISEGQRFVTRLMSEGRQGNALSSGEAPARPIAVHDAEKVGVPR